ncbi:MAG: DegT/DnrJ/EryC1/StrS family aminotransferase [Acidobacteria bacterium]|nr:DegT/DnrJ/EryC1/StrS family aminotransferase [Acidobacteriota bacterium]
MNYKVPFVNARSHYRRLQPEMDAAIAQCLLNGDMICRTQLRDFEMEFAEFVGTKYSVGVNSGYHALEFSLRALDVGCGDEVITPAHTFVATVSAIVNCGATPVLVEVGSDFNIDPDAFDAAITPRTKAVIPVHLNGRMAKMDRIMAIAARHGLRVIEDAAQSAGAAHMGRKAGSIGAAGCWSFYPFKILGGFGDGGAITTDDPQIARSATLLRYNGEDRDTGEYHCHGYTALLDNVQAAVLHVKLRYLPVFTQHRRKIARLYHDHLAGIDEITLPPFDGDGHLDAFQNYVVMTPQRDDLRQHLTNEGIETLISWPKPMWEHRGLGLRSPRLPFTERICREVLSLPMSAETTEEQVDIVAQSVRTFFVRCHKSVFVTQGISA